MNFNGQGNFITRIPPVTRHLIIINLLIWLAEVCIPSLGNRIVELFGLHYWGADGFNPVQIFTSMFVHDNHSIVHVFFNMFSLWMFGCLLERVWDSRRFLVYYLICGVGAALVQEGVWAISWEHEWISSLAKANGLSFDSMKALIDNASGETLAAVNQGKQMMLGSMVTIGASGAVFGILLGFAFVFPNLPMYLFFIPVPIKAKYMVAGYAVLEFFLGIASFGGDNVAHFAHLGGLLFGIIILLIWKKQGKLRGGSFY